MIIYTKQNEFYKAFSDKGFYIERNGSLYEEALYIEFTEYNETNIPIPISEIHSSEYDEIIEGE